MVIEGRTTKMKKFSKDFRDASHLIFNIDVFAANKDADKDWIRDPQGIPHYQRFLFRLLISPIIGELNPGFAKLFAITADLSKLEDKLVEMEDDNEETYYQLDFEVELVFDAINLEGNIVYEVRTVIPFFIIPLTSVFLRKKDTATRDKYFLPLTKIVDIYSPTHDINYLFDV
jgi:hypothetical protein